METTLPIEPSRWMAALFPPAPGLNVAWLQVPPQAQAHSGRLLLPQCLTPAQIAESLPGFEGCLENVTQYRAPP